MGFLERLGLKSTTVARNVGLTDPRLYAYGSGGASYSGEQVSVANAMQLDTVWACVRLKSQTIATLSCQLFKLDDSGRGVIERDHPLYEILRYQPNADMTAPEFWECMSACVELWGNAYAEIVRSGKRITALNPLRPDFMTVRRQGDGSLLFVYSFQGRVTELDESDVFHIKGFSLDGMVGLSPVTMGRQQLGTAIAAEKAQGNFFRNGLRANATMNTTTTPNATQMASAREYMKEISGVINSGNTPLLPGGWELKPLSLPPKDAELLQTISYSVEVICRWFDVPPILIHHMEKSTAWGTGLEQVNMHFLDYSLRTRLVHIESSIRRCLLTPGERKIYEAKFNVDGLLRADSEARSKLYSVYAQNGVMTRNEMRALENLPPLPGGDDLTVQVNLVPIELLGEVVKSQRDMLLDPSYQPPGPADPAGSEASQDAPKVPTKPPAAAPLKA